MAPPSLLPQLSPHQSLGTSLGTLQLLWRIGSYFIMPRGPRLDAPGVLHHVMARGIMRQAIFRDDSDRNNFVARLGALASARVRLLEYDNRCALRNGERTA